MKAFEEAKIEIVRLAAEDIITTSPSNSGSGAEGNPGDDEYL